MQLSSLGLFCFSLFFSRRSPPLFQVPVMLRTSPPPTPVHRAMTSCLPLTRLHRTLYHPISLLYFRWGGFTKRKTVLLNTHSCCPYHRLGTGEKVFEMKEVGWSLLEGGRDLHTRG